MEDPDVQLPSGIVTFLFTDIEGSTRLLHRLGDEMEPMLEVHNALLIRIARDTGGVFLKAVGDGLFFAFADASCALAAAVAAQQALSAHRWPCDVELRVRMGLNKGPANPNAGDYVSLAVNQAARICAAAHGGQILVSDAVLEDAGLPEAVSVSPLGSYRLKDFDAPVRLSQLEHPTLRKGFPALRAVRHRGHNLGLPATSFVGREREQRELSELRSGHRLISVVGAGGSGKTRLAAELATSLVDEHPDGVWIVPLAGLTPGSSIVDAVAATVGVCEQVDADTEAALLDHLETRRALLVLDNCEHVLDSVGKVVGEILGRCPDVGVMATSRERLAIPGELVFRLDVLPIPPADTPIEHLVNFDSVRLFLERAGLADAQFGLTEANAAAVSTICRQTDGIPLAIELAAARISTMSAPAIAAGLERGFSLLRQRGGHDRHRTLYDTLMWSHDLLDDDEQALWRRLSVFVGGFAWESVVAVMRTDEASLLGVFGSLLDKSVIAFTGGERYGLHETVREFAKERLEEADESEVYGRRHAQWVYSLVRGLYEKPISEGSAARYGEERENVLAAWAYWNSQPVTEQWLRLSASLAKLEFYAGHPVEAKRILSGALQRSEGDLSGRAELFAEAAWVFDYLEPTRAEEYARRAISEGTAEGDTRAAHTGRYVLANLLCRQGRTLEAMDEYLILLSLADAHGHLRQKAAVLSGAATCAWALDNAVACRKYGEELVQTARSAGDTRAEAIGHIRIALAADLDGAPGDYRFHVHRAHELAESSGDRILIIETTLCVAVVADEDEARSLVLSAIETVLTRELPVDAELLFAVAQAVASAGLPATAAQLVGGSKARQAEGDKLAPPDERAIEALTERLQRELGSAALERHMEEGGQRSDLLVHGVEALRRVHPPQPQVIQSKPSV